MDSLTHIVVGGCIGELIAGKRLGKKAIVLGALANSLPDIDVVSSLWLSTTQDLLAHRGFTHSILFVLLLTPLLAWSSGKLFKTNGIGFNKWCFFWGIQLLCHLFLDSFNSYGTGLFEPFSHYRVSFNAMFVADPMFTIWPSIVFVFLLVLKTGANKRIVLAKVALILSGLYLLSDVVIKAAIDSAVRNDLQAKNINVQRYFTTPTPLNNQLWYVVAQNDSGYYIGYRSIMDKGPAIDFHYTPGNKQLLQPLSKDADLQRLLRFSKGYYAVEQWHDTLVFNDMRFGEIAGWAEAHPRFIFYYFLQHPKSNDMIVQRGRFAKWDRQMLFSFLNRMKGI